MRDRVKSLVVSGYIEYQALDMRRAREFYEQAVEIAAPLGDKRGLALLRPTTSVGAIRQRARTANART